MEEDDTEESAMVEAMEWKPESSAIASECDSRRAALDSSDQKSLASQTFTSLQWAVALLHQIESEKRYALGEEGKKEKKASGEALKKEFPAVGDDNAVACDSVSGLEKAKKGEIESEADEEHGTAEDSEALQISSRAKRAREGECDVEERVVGEEEPSGGDDLETAVQAAVQEADSGAAGVRIVERMETRLAQRDCRALTDLISHCLLVSLDLQPLVENTMTSSPPPSPRDFIAEGSTNPTVPDSEKDQRTIDHGSEHMVLNAEEEGKQRNYLGFSDAAWLHKWLLRYLMRNHDNFRILHREPLDWLLAHSMASNPTLFLKLVFEDLVQELVGSDSQGWAAIAIYVQRVGIVDYAALKMPEYIFPVLQSMLSDLQPAIELTQRGECKIEDRSVRRLVGTLSVCVVMATLCPQFLGAFAHLWVPMLTVKNVQVWSKLLLMVDQEVGVFLPSIGAVLVGVSLQEPTLSAWLCALFSWRLSELAPVGADVVLLLNHLIDASSLDEATQHLSDVSDLLLHMLCRDLTKGVLRRVLGAYRPCCEAPLDPFAATAPQEEIGVGKFVANLKNNVHRLWSEALNLCSNSTCRCCRAASSDRTVVDPSIKTDGGQSVNVIATSSGSDDKVHFDKSNRLASMDIDGETDKTLGDSLGQEQDFLWSRERGCQLKDPFVRICHLVILSSSSHMVAEVIAEATLLTLTSKGGFERRSLKKLLVIMQIMQMMASQGRGAEVIERWGQLVVNDLAVSSNEQALMKLLAVRQLLDPRFWQNHLPVQEHVTRSSVATDSEQNDEDMEGLTSKLVLQLVRKELDFHWLQLLLLLHRKDAWNLQLVVLGLLQLLSPDKGLQPQAITARLKGALGIYFWWLENGDDKSSCMKSGASGRHGGLPDKWQQVRVLEQLKHVIVQLAAATSSTFTLMVSSLLDYSFERCAHNPDFQMRKSNLHRRGIGAGGRGYLSVANLVSGRLDQHGNFKLVSVPTLAEKKRDGFSLSPGFLLTKENHKIKSGGLSSLDVYEREKLGPRYSKGDLAIPSLPTVIDSERRRKDDSTERTIHELTRLLQWALQRAVLQFSENPDAWPHPANALATMMVDRLETPYEMPMTMEQYEEVLPKQVSSSRHIFLTDWFVRNPLLFEMLELVVKQGETHEIMRCVEFVQVLLADNISRWHSAYRTRRDPSVVAPGKASKEETFDRLQVIRLIQLVTDAGWLPQPLASSTEIVELIDGADIADLLLLVWRCMHHAMAFGSKYWVSYSHNVNHGTAGASDDPQVPAAEENKEGTYTEWEGQYFGILRRNIAQIGALFARVYPLRSAF